MRVPSLVLLTIAAVACGGDPLPLRDCTPGASLACACVGGATGAQLCDAAGHLEACVCPDAGPSGDVVDSAQADVVDAAQDVPAPDVAAPLDVPVIDAPDVAVPLDTPAVDHQVTDASLGDDGDAAPNSGDASSDASADVADCNTASDPANCGTCGTVCSLQHTTAVCVSGACRVPEVDGGYMCAAGYLNCDGRSANGCEVDSQTSAVNCGACARACSTVHGTPSCTSGRCAITCAAGWCDHDGNVANGCEASC